jgi:hypothetical protein
MRINDTVIVTPIDNPGQFDPDWRNSIALALSDSSERIDPVYIRYKSDPWIQKQMAYFRAVKRGLTLTREQTQFRLAYLWFQGTNLSDVRFRLEPLLLTAVPYDIIALDILGECDDIQAIKAYEKLYFNIRDAEGRLSRSCQLKQYFSLPSGQFDRDTPPEQMWKMVASLMGYDTLVSIWLWKDAHGIKNNSQEYLLDEMWRLAQSRLFMSMFADRVGHESMAKLLSAVSSQQKLLREGKHEDDNGIETMRALQDMLYLVSPRVIDSTAKEVDEKMKREQAVQARMDTEKAVDAVVLDETGKNGVKLIEERA